MSSLFFPLLSGKWESPTMGDTGEKPQVVSWKCPSLLRSKSLSFCLVSLIPAQQQPQHLSAPPSPCSDVEPELLPSPFPHHIIAKAGSWWGFATADLAKECLEISGWGFRCLCGEMEGGWPGPHPRHRLLCECSLSQA